MIEGLVSTIVPVYNRPRQLREAVESALSQDYWPIDIVMVDDGSTDETCDVAQALAHAYPDVVRVARQANAGPGAARETGRKLARGEFIQYLDSDDLLLPGKFSAQVAALRADPTADVAYGITHMRDADGNLSQEPHKRTGERIAAMFPAFLMSRWWETATPLYRRTVTDEAGPWTALSLEEDWEYDCRVASLGGRLVWVPVPVSEHRDHAGARLSRGDALDPKRMRHRAESHLLILAHALRANVSLQSDEMQHFARELFLLARQCGAVGLPVQSRELFAAARRASGPQRARGVDYRTYRAVASVIGWTAAGRASHWFDRLRGGVRDG
jgi:GT2 family glycosyltransferase